VDVEAAFRCRRDVGRQVDNVPRTLHCRRDTLTLLGSLRNTGGASGSLWHGRSRHAFEDATRRGWQRRKALLKAQGGALRYLKHIQSRGVRPTIQALRTEAGIELAAPGGKVLAAPRACSANRLSRLKDSSISRLCHAQPRDIQMLASF
jgi:hypothetical protein